MPPLPITQITTQRNSQYEWYWKKVYPWPISPWQFWGRWKFESRFWLGLKLVITKSRIWKVVFVVSLESKSDYIHILVSSNKSPGNPDFGDGERLNERFIDSSRFSLPYKASWLVLISIISNWPCQQRNPNPYHWLFQFETDWIWVLESEEELFFCSILVEKKNREGQKLILHYLVMFLEEILLTVSAPFLFWGSKV